MMILRRVPLILAVFGVLVCAVLVEGQQQRREDVLRDIAAGKTNARSISRVTSPQEAWEQIKLRSIEELKVMIQELEISLDGDDIDDLDEDDLRSLAYDEDVIELWFKKHPEEITKYKPEPKEKKKKKPAAAASSPSSSNSAKNKQKNTGKSGIMGAITSAFNSVLGVFTGAGTEL